jgi:hypothetical protein
MSTVPSSQLFTTKKSALVWQVLFFAAVPIVGMIFLGWDWREILVLYWLENVSLGITSVVKMLMTPISGGGAAGTFGKFFLVFFFMIHYGMFCTVHGVFVFLLVYGEMPIVEMPATPFNIGPVLMFWLLSLGWQIIMTVVKMSTMRQSGKTVDVSNKSKANMLSDTFVAPYARIVPLHIAIIFGVMLMTVTGLQYATAVLLIVIHTAVDLGQAGLLKSLKAHRD